jgi:hypothetical protein
MRKLFEFVFKGISQSNDWRFSYVNKDFSFCDTYPRVLVVPQSISDDELRQVAEFRSKHRIPVLSWIKYNQSYGSGHKNHAALLRSSQPMCGIKQKRSEKDEHYLHTIYYKNQFNALDKLFIIDARPHVNAVANLATGGGYESEDNYSHCELVFLNIQNIHVMRESLRKIYEMAAPSPTNYTSSLLSSSNGAIYNLSSAYLVNASVNNYPTIVANIAGIQTGVVGAACNVPASLVSVGLTSNNSFNSNSSSGVLGSNSAAAAHQRVNSGAGFTGASAATASVSSSSSSSASAALLTSSSGSASIGTTSASTDEKNYFVNLENSKWLEHIRCILSGAMRIVKFINTHRSSVLVHCSDGWDRTSQVFYYN